jgi:hypothetical protein
MVTLSATSQDLPHFRLNVKGGYSYFLQTDPNEGGSQIFIHNDDYKKYEQQLKWGQNIEGNVHYLLNNGLGLGAKYRYLTTDASRTDLLFDAGEHYGVVSIAEKNKIIFLAPSLIFARWLEPTGKFLGTGTLSVGYIYLESSGEVDNSSAMFYGDHIGFQIDLGVDYFLTRHISIGIGSGYFYGKIKEVNINLSQQKTKLPESAQPNLSNIQLDLSLSFNF